MADEHQQRIAALEQEERTIVQQLEELRKLIEQEKAQLITTAQQDMRERMMPQESAREAVARLEVFTLAELCTELSYTRAQGKQLLEAMMCSKPPKVKAAGKLGRSPLYEYVGR